MAANGSISSVFSALENIDRDSFANDDERRVQALRKAEALVQRLEKPLEKVNRIVFGHPITLVALKTAADLDLFSRLSTESSPQSSAELAAATKCDPALMYRLLRVIALERCVEQVGETDLWYASHFSEVLASPTGLVNGIHYHYDGILLGVERIPSYLAEHDYMDPISSSDAPVHAIYGSDLWTWLSGHPKALAHFQNLLASYRPLLPQWPDYFPISQLFDNPPVNPEKVFAVDVGGGHGADMRVLCDRLPEQYKTLPITIQDLPAVIEKTKARGDLPSNVTADGHDFFMPQPAHTRGARIYHLRAVFHDWNDEQVVKILNRVKEAMTPGYSQILVQEIVLPLRAVDAGYYEGTIDLWMLRLAARERNRSQWEHLIESVDGLKIKKYWKASGLHAGVMEVDLQV